MRAVLLSLLVLLAKPSLAAAETFVYFLGHPWEVPAPFVLLVGGLALIAIGIGVRKWRERTRYLPRARPDV
jgi:hypothetical protein